MHWAAAIPALTGSSRRRKDRKVTTDWTPSVTAARRFILIEGFSGLCLPLPLDPRRLSGTLQPTWRIYSQMEKYLRAKIFGWSLTPWFTQFSGSFFSSDFIHGSYLSHLKSSLQKGNEVCLGWWQNRKMEKGTISSWAGRLAGWLGWPQTQRRRENRPYFT